MNLLKKTFLYFLCRTVAREVEHLRRIYIYIYTFWYASIFCKKSSKDCVVVVSLYAVAHRNWFACTVELGGMQRTEARINPILSLIYVRAAVNHQKICSKKGKKGHKTIF